MSKRYYKAKAKEWALAESGTGKEQIAVQFDILTEGAQETRLTWYGYFTDNTWERTLESLRHMGWQGDDLQVLQGLDTNEVELVVDDEEYEGKVTAKIQWVNKLGGLAIKAPLTADRARSFAASMRDKIRGKDAAGGKRALPASSGDKRPEPPPPSDFDAPF